MDKTKLSERISEFTGAITRAPPLLALTMKMKRLYKILSKSSPYILKGHLNYFPCHFPPVIIKIP